MSFCGNETKGVEEVAVNETIVKSTEKPEYFNKEKSVFYNRVFQLLSEGEVPKSVIVDELVNQNWNPIDAEKFIKKVEYELLNKKKYQPTTERQKLAAKYKNNMLGGAITAVVGTIITIVSFNVATNSGGTYLLCWGAIIFGII